MNTNVSQKQINALKYLILHSRVNQEVKKILFALIDASEKFTIPVAFTTCSRKTIYNLEHVIHSDGVPPHLNEIMKLLGVDYNPNRKIQTERGMSPINTWGFSRHDGYLSEGEFIISMRPGKKYTRTVWLSFEWYDRQAKEITQEQVDAVELADHLYDR